MTIVELTERLDGLPGVFGGAALARRTLIPPPVIPKPEVTDTAGSAVWGPDPVPAATPVGAEREAWARVVAMRRGYG